jgi:hypothetical protein
MSRMKTVLIEMCSFVRGFNTMYARTHSPAWTATAIHGFNSIVLFWRRPTTLKPRLQQLPQWNPTRLMDRTKKYGWMSPTLTWFNPPPSTFTCGSLKDVVYRRRRPTLGTLREETEMSCAAIVVDMLAAVVRALTGRTEKCLQANYGHFEHLFHVQHVSKTINICVHQILFTNKLFKQIFCMMRSFVTCTHRKT